jgi:CHASE3 domain sensor protein
MPATSRSASASRARPRRRARSCARENAELAETFRVENAAVHEIQEPLRAVNRERQEIADFIDANEAAIQESAGVEDGLVRIVRELDEANAPMKEIRTKNDEFLQRTAELRERMIGQLGEIAELIELLRSKI